MKHALTFFLASLFFFGCSMTRQIPMTSSINDFVMMGTKSNGKVTVQYSYESKVQDGEVFIFKNDDKAVADYKMNQTENSTLKKMLSEYMGNKFSKISDDGTIKIKVELLSLYVKEYPLDSEGKQVMTAIFGGETNTGVSAKIQIKLTVDKDGETLEKLISASAEDTYVQGVGTGTSTSNIYRGTNSIEYVHAKNLNSVNNKALMMLNSYFEEIGL